MNCDYCEKDVYLKVRKPKKHTNVYQPVPIHYFCSVDCRDLWLERVRR